MHWLSVSRWVLRVPISAVAMSKASPVNNPTKRTKTNHEEDRKECPPLRPSAAVLETMDRYHKTQQEIQKVLDSLMTAHQGVGGHRGGKATLKVIQQHVFWDSIVAEWRRQCLLKLQTGEVVPRPLGMQLIHEQPVEKKKAGDSSQCCEEGFRKMLDPHNPRS